MSRLPFAEIVYNVAKSNLLQSKKETHTTQYSNKHFVKKPSNIFWTTAWSYKYRVRMIIHPEPNANPRTQNAWPSKSSLVMNRRTRQMHFSCTCSFSGIHSPFTFFCLQKQFKREICVQFNIFVFCGKNGRFALDLNR